MAKIRFETGQTVNFDGNPTQADIDEVAQKLGINKNIQSPGHSSTDPNLQGGAMSPANVQAKKDIEKAQFNTNMMDIPIVPMAALNQFSGNIPRMLSGGKFPQPTTTEGRFVSDIGGVAGAVTSPVLNAALRGVGLLASPITKPIGKYIAESKVVGEGLKKLEGVFTKPLGLPKSELIDEIVSRQNKIVSKLREDRNILNKNIFKESDKAAIDIQQELPGYFKRNSDLYGKELDRISDDLVNNNNNITKGEMSNILDDVIKESQDDLLASGKPMEEIEYLKNKYSLEPARTESNIILDKSERPFETIIESNPNEPLDFKQVVEDVKGIRKSLSAKAKAGEKYSPEDVVAAKFSKRWGDYLETKVPDLKKLNQEYAPVIETMKIAGKYFKPYSKGNEKLSGVSFLTHVAKDNLQTTEKNLLNILENGTPNFPGIGKKTGNLENIKNMQGKVSKEIDDAIKEYGQHKENARRLLAREKELKDARNKVIGVLTGTGLLTGAGAYIGKKMLGVN